MKWPAVSFRLLFLFGFTLGWLGVDASAEKIPALVQVSPKLSAEEQAVFQDRKLELEAVLHEFIAASDRFNAKSADQQTDAEFDALTDQRARYIASAHEYNSHLAARVQALESGDPMVVDARNVASGLWQGMDSAIATAYSDAPAGVSDRVRKGFQAIMDRDWKVAKAWFEDALNRDPDNAGLKRLVALAGSSVHTIQKSVSVPGRDRPSPPSDTSDLQRAGVSSGVSEPARFIPGTAIQLPDPKDLYFLFPGLQALKEREMMDMLFGLEAPSPPQKPVGPKAANDKPMPLPPKAINKPNWGAFFDALLMNPPKGKRSIVNAVRG